MYETNGSDIKIPYGDTAAVIFTFLMPDGETPYIFEDGQYARLDVYKTAGSEPDITITVPKAEQSQDGSVVFGFCSDDTSIDRGTYFYTVKLISSGGTGIDTVHGALVRADFEII